MKIKNAKISGKFGELLHLPERFFSNSAGNIGQNRALPEIVDPYV
jgi:hypothetical protein